MEFACGNIFVRTADPMKAGEVVEGHSHNFDHATSVAIGGFSIERTVGEHAETIEVHAGELPVLIKAGVKHKLTALVDGSVYHCIYAHRLPQGDVVQRYTGWLGAYT